MLLSVIIPTYNSEKVIERAITSVLRQTFSDFEVLIMDGCSQDRTVEIVQGLCDSRINVHSEPDKGIYDAMNKGITRSKGVWLYFLGSDDYLLNDNVLEKLFRSWNQKSQVIYGDVEAPHLPKAFLGEWQTSDICYNRCHQAIFYKRELFDVFGCYNLRYPVLADFDFNLNWFLSRLISKQYINLEIAHYSSGGYSSYAVDKLFLEEFSEKIIKLGYWQLSLRQKIMFLGNIRKNKNSIIYSCLFWILRIERWVIKRVYPKALP